MEPSNEFLDRFNGSSAMQLPSVDGMTPMIRLVEFFIAKALLSFSTSRGMGPSTKFCDKFK